ncbi:hypothetical protein B0H17DRAFT_1212697 [Mycena rosella]|uniref:Uncharacterized protein n=1 Tax=Mycena rosella TaxID=1033263 RepID=A0AAD7G5Z3_MYCRO|nr:hypothetical protein B0H17DRAFT_1212697 [Mycena rosella]
MTQPSSRRTKDTPQSSEELLATLLLHGVHLGSPLTLAQEWPVVVKREGKVVPAVNMHDNREQLDLVSSRAPQFCFCNPLPNFGRKLNPPHTPLLRSAASATSLVYAYDQNNRWPAPAEPSASSGSHHVHARACSPDFTTVLYEYLDLECTSITPYQAALRRGKMASNDPELPMLPPKDPFADAEADGDDPLPMVQELSFALLLAHLRRLDILLRRGQQFALYAGSPRTAPATARRAAPSPSYPARSRMASACRRCLRARAR